MFSLRYVEGELLHYTRDDSVFRRRRHAIGVVLSGDLEGARVVDHGMPWQRLILALGVVVAASRWLAEHLGDRSLVVQLGFPPGALAEEREIAALLLEGEIARGIVAIVAQPPAETVVWIAAASGNAIADLVVISLSDGPALPNGVRALHVDLAAPLPVIRELAPRPAAHIDASIDRRQDPWIAWRDAAEDVLRWLM